MAGLGGLLKNRAEDCVSLSMQGISPVIVTAASSPSSKGPEEEVTLAGHGLQHLVRRRVIERAICVREREGVD